MHSYYAQVDHAHGSAFGDTTAWKLRLGDLEPSSLVEGKLCHLLNRTFMPLRPDLSFLAADLEDVRAGRASRCH